MSASSGNQIPNGHSAPLTTVNKLYGKLPAGMQRGCDPAVLSLINYTGLCGEEACFREATAARTRPNVKNLDLSYFMQ